MDRAGQEMSVLHVALFMEHQFSALIEVGLPVIGVKISELFIGIPIVALWLVLAFWVNLPVSEEGDHR